MYQVPEHVHTELLSAEVARKHLAYDAETGFFSWLVHGGKRRVGARAGSRHSKGYRCICLLERMYFEHRLAFLIQTGAWPEQLVDHINGERDDNRWANLRSATPTLNQQNLQRAPSNSATGLIGAFLCRTTGLYRARIKVDKKIVELGRHKTAEEAHRAYLTAKRSLHEGCTI